MKYLPLISFFLCCAFKVSSQIYTGPIPKPASGYGSEGSETVAEIAFNNPNFNGEDIRIYYPANSPSSRPTLFYSHGYGGSNPLHVIGLFNFMARKGYAIVFVPYQTVGVSIQERYTNLLEGFRQAARTYPHIIDTTRVGFLGHSFGGGASLAMAHRCFTEHNWGQNGRFMNPSAPWYSFNLSQEDLQSFPSDTKMLTLIYTDDGTNDHRMAAEVFNNTNIPTSEKDFITVFPSNVNGYAYTAGHNLPTSYAEFDAMDYYAYYRLLDALCDYTFKGNPAGKEVALGNGSAAQISMPNSMTDLVQTDQPVITRDESLYSFPCSAVANPRQAFCNTLSSTESPTSYTYSIFPNPTQDFLIIDAPATQPFQVSISDLMGRTLVRETNQNRIEVSNLTKGVYLMTIIQGPQTTTLKFLKE